jgi:hypothetical protein
VRRGGIVVIGPLTFKIPPNAKAGSGVSVARVWCHRRWGSTPILGCQGSLGACLDGPEARRGMWRSARTPPPPEWVDRLLEALSGALGAKVLAEEPATWHAEDELFDAAFLIVRARFGRSRIEDPYGVARWRIERSLKALDAEVAS